MLANELIGGHYLEPYAGGAGVALSLLFDGVVEQIHINDADPAIAVFWRVASQQTDELVQMIANEPLTIDAWHHWRAVMLGQEPATELQRGFATLFMNRTNRSGILKGGVIGGKAQSGTYKVGDRFMREKATDSQMRDMIDNAHRKHAQFIDEDRYTRRQEHYDIVHEKAQENIEQTYKELKDHFKRDDIKIEEMPALIAQKVKDTAEGAEIDQKITEELNNFNADVKNYEYSTDVLNKIEDRKQAITDEVNSQIDQINKYRENAKMQTYVKPIVNEGRKLRKLEDHLRGMK
jgi:hypothetical protein